MGERPGHPAGARRRRPHGAWLAWVALVAALLAAGAIACTLEPASVPTSHAATARASGTAGPPPGPSSNPYATLPPAATPASVDPAIAAVTHALQSHDAGELAPLLLDVVAIGSESDTANLQELPRADALEWLSARWGERPSVIASNFVEHFVLLVIETQGWKALTPQETGQLSIHLHLYDAASQPDTIQGEWRIDGLFYR